MNVDDVDLHHEFARINKKRADSGVKPMEWMEFLMCQKTAQGVFEAIIELNDKPKKDAWR